MKSVALIFVLAVFTGCNARVLQQADAVPNRWEESVTQFWQQIADLNQKADGVVQNLKASQLSRELDTLITDTMADLAIYRDSLQDQLRPYTETSTGQLSLDVKLLVDRLQRDMLDAKDRSTVYLGELKSMVEQNSGDVHSRINVYTHKLKKRLGKDTEEIRNTVAAYLGELQSRTVQNLEAAKDQVQPYVEQAGDTATKKLSDMAVLLKNQAELLGQQLESQAEGFKTQLEAIAQELRASMDGRMEDLTDMLSPYAAQIREKIEGIVDKVKETTTI